MFYPGGPAPCRRQIETMMPPRDAFQFAEAVRGVLVPHAGWAYSGVTATRGLVVLGASGEPETVVLFGAVHRWGLPRPALYGAGAWRTPLGDVLVDEELAARCWPGGEAVVTIPTPTPRSTLSRYNCPSCATSIPRPAFCGGHAAVGGCRRAGQVVARAATALGAGPWRWHSDLTTMARATATRRRCGRGGPGLDSDQRQRLIDLAVGLRVDEIMDEAEAHHNACGPGALAAAMAFSRELAPLGVVAQLYHQLRRLARGPASDVVGYGAVTFL
jgi:predicted class III extradiol MEMO1 family dioxygenase